MTDLITAARAFAEAAHAGQTRKGAAREPYVVHLEEVAGYVAGHGGSDVAVAAAWLHDTVEDCGVTPDEIAARFGPEVAAVVAELTDDKARPKAERKRLQEINAPGKSADAALVKACDKLSNLRALVESPPVHWDRARRHAYVDWAERVVAALPAAADPVRPALAAAVARARAALG
ncbi:HD domain-containing protein [Phaeovulum vinaykumarii]|uniref:Metal dependent phosphohydrolase n=1 Tax=Phaeovulum vinaykumarii TaxID=407234 RepID=A0A1N7L7J0_9RHOB|nr:HD domain-containing protein [Phaeovulum vinaykumarii]SIS69650.1 metal dependent phosphohydrolase [Phaeovulum vinaykumarii]SOB99386.1 metal dependent phosphohydrolase [Phaeovulum vinaykumarii]